MQNWTSREWGGNTAELRIFRLMTTMASLTPKILIHLHTSKSISKAFEKKPSMTTTDAEAGGVPFWCFKNGGRAKNQGNGVKPLLHTHGAEVAGGEVGERLEGANQLGAGNTALPVERAQKVGSGALAFAGVAFETARNQVAARVGTELGAGYDVVEALHLGADAAEAVEADAPFAGVDGLAEIGCSHEIDFLEVAGVRRGNGHACLGSA